MLQRKVGRCGVTPAHAARVVAGDRDTTAGSRLLAASPGSCPKPCFSRVPGEETLHTPQSAFVGSLSKLA